MATYAMIFSGRKRVEIASPADAQATFDKWASDKSLSARSFTQVPVIDVDAKKVLGYFSMNGRFWTQATADAGDWKLLHDRYFNKHL